MRRLLVAILSAASAWGAGQPYSAGTAINEDFGNIATHPEACWSGGSGTSAQCAQLWLLTQGSGQQIVTAPAEFGGGNALYLPASGTAIKLETYGSFPVIPGGSGYTLELAVKVSAHASGTPALLQLRPYSGGTVNSYISSSGTGFYTNGGTCAASVGFHSLRITVASGTNNSHFYLDGSPCGSAWTDSGAAVGHIAIYGGTTYDTHIKRITINGTTVTGNWPPSVFMDFAGQAGATVNAANLAAGQYCGNAVDAWTATSMVGTSFSFVAGGQPFANPLSVCVVSYAGTSNVSLRMDVTTTANSAGSWSRKFWSVYGGYATGFFFKFSTAGTVTGVDISGLKGNSGAPSYVLQIQNVSGTYRLCGENANGASTSACTTAQLTQNTWYWASYNMTPTGIGNAFGLYSVSGSLIESVAFPGTPYATAPGFLTLALGKVGAATLLANTTVWYSNVALSYADASGLIGPPLAGGIPAGVIW